MGTVMGGLSTASLQPEEVIELQQMCHFTQPEIRRLYKRFRKLDTTKSGGVTRKDLLKIPELSMNPLAERITSLFKSQGQIDGSFINFRDFLRMLSVFSERASREEKERMAFRVYDMNRDNFISENDLYEVLKTMIGENVTDKALWQIVRNTIKDADLDGDGKLSFSEFQNVMRNEDFHSKMTIEFTDPNIRLDP